MALHHLEGEMSTRRIWLDGVELLPDRSLKLMNHSPDGFAWGYGGSGPAQLALAICLELLPDDKRENLAQDYQTFKWQFIANLPQADFACDFDLEQFI